MRSVTLLAVASLFCAAAPASAGVFLNGNVFAARSGKTMSTKVGRSDFSQLGKAGGRIGGGNAPATSVANQLAARVVALASATVCQSPGCVQPNANVMFNTGMSGATVQGTLNNSPALVNFTGNEALATSSNGQARISGADGNLTSLTFGLAGGGTFNEVEFNLNALANGFVTLTFMGTSGTLLVTDPLAIGANGQNFFGASGGDFTSVTINSTAQLGDVRQIRLGGISLQSAVPEAGTWAMMLLGFGAIGLGLRNPGRRRLPQLA